MPAISTQDLSNAKIDVDHISDVINGSETLNGTGIVTTRLGQQAKTFKKLQYDAIQTYTAYNNRGAWVTGTSYLINDVWESGGVHYLVLADYTSGASAAADISGGNVIVHQPKDWVQTVVDVATLRLTEPMYDGQIISLLGTTGANVNHGSYYADFGDTSSSDDGLSVVVTTSGSKRWIKLEESYALNDDASQAKSIHLKLRQYAQTSDYPDSFFAGSSHQTAIQGIIDDIASNNASKGKRELVIDREHTFSSHIVIPSNFKLIFEDNGIILPNADTVKGINNQNTLPATTYSLDADVLEGADRIDLGSNSSNFSVGDYIFIKSADLITTSPNFNDLVKAQTAMVLAKSGDNLILDCATEYAFLASNTTVGKITGNHNITLENFNFGRIGTQIGNTGADFRYINNLKINDFYAENNRTAVDPDGANNRQNVHGINIVGCSNVLVDRFQGKSLGYYGVNVDSCSRNIELRNIEGSIMRHLVSINWNGYGQTLHFLCDNISGDNMHRGVMDTHDVGRDITFRKVRAKNCLTDGGQIRTSNVLVEDYKATHCGNNGLIIYITPDASNPADITKLNNIKLRDIECNDNGKRGVGSVVALDLDGIRCSRNGATSSQTDNGGISLNGGRIKNGFFSENNGPAITYRDPSSLTGIDTTTVKKSLTLEQVEAPYDATKQQWFLYSPDTYEDEDVKLRDVTAIGYSTANLFSRASSSYVADIDDEGCKWSNDEVRGSVNLSSGSATVTNANAKFTGTPTARQWRSRINLERIVEGSAPGHLTITMVDSTSFTITSSNASDDGKIAWSFV